MRLVQLMSKCVSIVRCTAEGLPGIYREQKLLIPQHDYTSMGTEPIIRSGLYIIRTSTSVTEEQIYVVYWPEDTTWDDYAVSMVQRNRVMFMRYRFIPCYMFPYHNDVL